MKAILLLVVVHLLIIHQSQKQLSPRKNERSLMAPVLISQKDSLRKEFIDHKEPLQYSSLELYMQEK